MRTSVETQTTVQMDPGVSPQTPPSKGRPAGFPYVASICQFYHPIMYTFSDHLASNANQSRRKGSPNIFLLPGEDFVPPTLTPKLIKTTACISKYGTDYTGDLDVTVGGHTCLPWSSPEAMVLSINKEFTSEISLPGNKCRNPDNDPEGPWCYVEISGNVTIDYCDLELCGKYGSTTESRDTAAVSQTWFGLSLSLFTINTEEFLSEDLPADTGAQQRTTLSSRKRFFSPRTFGQGEDGKPRSKFNALRNSTISNPVGQSLVNWSDNP